jgi:hypothetical protein
MEFPHWILWHEVLVMYCMDYKPRILRLDDPAHGVSGFVSLWSFKNQIHQMLIPASLWPFHFLMFSISEYMGDDQNPLGICKDCPMYIIVYLYSPNPPRFI